LEQKLFVRHGGFFPVLALSSWEGKMKLLLFYRATVVMAAAGAYAAENGPIRICVQHKGPVNNFVMARAQTVVNDVFSEAAIQIEWLPARKCNVASNNVLRIEMDAVAASGFAPQTMAYALPYRETGTTIHVFYDRVIQEHHELAGELLGHVMAHEIGHVLEGVARHSPGGLMKAHWGLKDYWEMKKQRLFFAAEDVELMHLHLQRAAARSVTAEAERE
jgi:hypothetical protein